MWHTSRRRLLTVRHRQFQYIQCTGLLLFLLASTSVAQDDKKKKEEWQTWLSGVAELEGASIIVDVDLRTRRPNTQFREQRGMETLERLSVLLNRGVREIDGTYVFHRYMEADDLRARSIHGHAMIWLRFLSGEDREELRSGRGLSWESVSPGDRKALEYVVRKLGGGVGDSMLDQAGNSVRMGVYFTPQIEFEDPKTGTTRRVSLSSGYPQLEKPEGQPARSQNPVRRQSPRNIARPIGGDLDFESGRIVSLAELFKLSVDQWDMRFWYDGRLSESLYFLSGRFDQDRFMECIEEVTRTVETMKTENDLSFITGAPVDNLLRSYFEDLDEDAEGTTKTVGDFLNGGSATLFEILGPEPSPQVRSILNQMGLSMDQQVTMKAAMALFFTAPGMTRVEGGEPGQAHFVSNTFGLSYRGS